MSKKNKTKPINRPIQRNTKIKRGDCFNCGNCQYHSEGDSYCDYEEPIFVLEDWCPTEEYLWCGGKYWTPQ